MQLAATLLCMRNTFLPTMLNLMPVGPHSESRKTEPIRLYHLWFGTESTKRVEDLTNISKFGQQGLPK